MNCLVLRSWLGGIALLCLSVSWVRADPGDEAILRAQEAFAARRNAALQLAVEAVPTTHVLAPYAEHWQLLRAFPGADDSRIATFLAAYPGSWMAERVRAEWLKDLARRELWSLYLAEFPRLVRPDASHQCYAHRAERMTGDARRLKEAIALWFTGRDMPSACTPLFEQLQATGYLQQEDLWRRIRLALEAGNPGVARAVSDRLPAGQGLVSASLALAERAPARWLKTTTRHDTRSSHEIALYALNRLARQNSSQAQAALVNWLPRLNEHERRAAWAILATEAARRHESLALSWFGRAGEGVNDSQREWWVRSALRAEQWPVVLRVIDGMSEAVRQQPVWRYWRARAQKATGQSAAANPALYALTQEHHYYGQLAREEVGPTVAAPPINIKTSGADIEAVARQPGVTRALALYRLGLRSEANQEWNWSLRGLSDLQLLAAAEVARRAEWYDRAIYAAEQTRDLHDFELRFIAPYRELAREAARSNNLDEAWVFGLMRQESRFVNVARSHVGATGLMQIMPATGRWIAGKLGIKGFSTNDMQDPATNIRFGAYYLKQVFDSLDGSPVLATAAYNAGPGRAQRWRDSRPMEGAIYVESIPFAETRDYVKKVLSNAMYYAVRFDQPSVLLKDRLGQIPPRRTARVAAANEPAGNDPDTGEN